MTCEASYNFLKLLWVPLQRRSLVWTLVSKLIIYNQVREQILQKNIICLSIENIKKKTFVPNYEINLANSKV